MRVLIAAAATPCGRISPAPLGSPLDRARLEGLRGLTGASVIGGATVREANPEMRLSGGELPGDRIRAVVSFSGDLPVQRRLFQIGPPPLVFTAASRAKRLAIRLGDRAEVIGVPESGESISLRHVVKILAARGVDSLLVEGGGRLNASFLAEKLVHEIHLTLVPHLSGDPQAASLLSPSPAEVEAISMPLRLASCEVQPSGEVFLVYTTLET